MFKLLHFAVTLGLMLTAAAASADPPYRLALAGGAPGGLFSLMGAGLHQAVSAAYPDSVVTYQPSGGGGVANIAQVSRGTVPMGLAEDLEVRLAWNGKEMFQEPVRNVRVLAWMYGAEARIHVSEFIVTEAFAQRHGLESLADLKDKQPPVRLAVNVRSNLEWMVTESLLDAVGVSFDDIRSWGGSITRGASPTQVELMSDRRIDIYTAGNPPGSSQIEQVLNAVPAFMLPMPEEAVNQVSEQLAGQPCRFEAGEYPVVKHDIVTLCHGGMILVHEDMDEQTAYDIARALVEQIDRYRAAHPVLKAVTPEQVAAPAPIPYHPGAERYFREAGLMQ